MNVLHRMRLTAIVLLVLLLGGCASSNMIRGQLTYDLRPEGARQSLVWPPAPETPRYRYLGELIGEPNFTPSDSTQSTLKTIAGWIVGLFEEEKKLTLLQRPQHGTVGDDGSIYVVDGGRNAVLRFDPNPPADDDSDNKDGHLLIWDMADDQTRFAGPVAIEKVWNGNLAVSDARLGFVALLNGKGQPVGKLGVGQLQRPTGLAFDRERGLLFITDTVANNIKVFDRDGKVVNTLGSPGEGKGEFNAPTHLSFSKQKLYVTDTLNSRIQVLDADGHRIGEFGERGLNVGNLVRPKGVLATAGLVYIVESYYNHLLIYNERGDLMLGINGTGLKEDHFLLPSGVWTDHQGRIFVADMFNARIVMFQPLTSGGS